MLATRQFYHSNKKNYFNHGGTFHALVLTTKYILPRYLLPAVSKPASIKKR